MKRLLIVEEALRDLKAHWFQYIQTICKGVEADGWKVDVACNKQADPEILKTFSSFPIFRHARYLDNSKGRLPGERFFGFILHSIRVLMDLWPLLKKRERYNHIFVPTVLVHHLLAWYAIMLLHPNKPEKLTLFFVTNPGVWDSSKGKAFLPKSTILLKRLLKLFTSQVKSRKVELAVETEGAKKEFEVLSGLPVTLLPHPVPFSGKHKQERQIQSEQTRVNQVAFSCLGFARHEKGSDLLKAAIESLVGNKDFNGHFFVQWTDSFKMPDGSLCDPGPVISTHPKVTIIDRPVHSDEYYELLLKTDCMVLPYRNSSYHARVSRIAIEAVCLGIPVIYTKGGWLQETIESFGSGIGIEDESIDSLKKAIILMDNEFENYSANAVKIAEKAIEYYAPENFCRLLLNREKVRQKNVIETVVE